MTISPLFVGDDYQLWLKQIKNRIRSARLGMALAANRELIRFYWDLGGMIAAKQVQSQWGDKVIPQLSHDLQREFPEVRGLSASNLKYCQRFFQFYSSDGGDGDSPTDIASTPFGQQPVDQIPWGHNILIFTKCASVAEAGFYIFYLSAVDSLLKSDDDQPTIGLLLCRDKNNIEVEFALRDMNKPMGVSEYTIVETLPDNLKGALPTVEEIEQDLWQLQEGSGE